MPLSRVLCKMSSFIIDPDRNRLRLCFRDENSPKQEHRYRLTPTFRDSCLLSIRTSCSFLSRPFHAIPTKLPWKAVYMLYSPLDTSRESQPTPVRVASYSLSIMQASLLNHYFLRILCTSSAMDIAMMIQVRRIIHQYCIKRESPSLLSVIKEVSQASARPLPAKSFASVVITI